MTPSISNIRFGRLAASVFTRDMWQAYAFYRDVLGFRRTFENGTPASFMILVKDDAELQLSLVKDHKASSANVAALLVEDVDAVHDILVAAGVRITKCMADKDYGLRAFVFADPDGNRIDVGERIEGRVREPPQFRQRDLSRVGFGGCRLAEATFEDVDLSNAVFSDVNLRSARLVNVDLRDVSIEDANIEGLKIFGIDVQALVRAELAERARE